MNEEIENNQEFDDTAAELSPDTGTDTAEVPEGTPETGTDTGTLEENGTGLEEDNGEPEESGTETVVPLPEVPPDGAELPSVSANDIPSVLPSVPVGPPQDTDNAEGLPSGTQMPVTELLESVQDFDELLAIVRELSETVTAQAYALGPSGLPMSGYEGYDYPVSVVYRIFPPALGSETGLSGTYSSPEEFNADYMKLQTDVQSGYLSYCYVRYVYDADDECVYDSEEYSLPGIPIEGYEGYSYPVAVKYRIFPTDLGKETFVTKTLSGPEAFSDDYKEMQRAVSAGNLNYCSIATVTDADGVLVYDSDAFQEGPGLPDGTINEILETLGNIDAGIQSIAGADAAYRTETMLLQEQNAELLQEAVILQQQNETLQKEMLASNVAVGFVLILTLGYTVAHGFFQRMKVG